MTTLTHPAKKTRADKRQQRKHVYRRLFWRAMGRYVSRGRFSIRRFLMLSVFGILTLILAAIAILNYYQLAQQNLRIYQVQLVNGAELLSAIYSVKMHRDREQALSDLLNQSVSSIHQAAPADKAYDLASLQHSQQNLVFQILNNQTGEMVKSPGAPEAPLSTHDFGFEHLNSPNGTSWYSFTLTNKTISVIIAVKEKFRKKVNDMIFLHDLIIILIAYVFIAILLLSVIYVGLSPLRRVVQEIAHRDSDHLGSINVKKVPNEIKPLVRELNKLFHRIYDSLEREKKFTADAAHELKTPLAALKMQVNVAIRETDDQKRRVLLDKIIAGSDRCAHIVNQLLTLSRLEPEAQLADTATIELTAISQKVIGMLANRALDKTLDIALMAPKKYYITGNETAMEILLRNLIENAIRYHSGGGKVQVVLNERHHKVYLHVIDDGPGVPKELQKRIFDRFYRQVGQKVSGSGLGLSIVSHIVRLHAGTVLAKTPKNGQGLEVVIMFPTFGG